MGYRVNRASEHYGSLGLLAVRGLQTRSTTIIFQEGVLYHFALAGVFPNTSPPCFIRKRPRWRIYLSPEPQPIVQTSRQLPLITMHI